MIGVIIAGISALASFVGSVGTAIATMGPSILATISQVSATLAEIATPLINALKTFGPMIEKVLDLIHFVAQNLKIGDFQINQEELGARALEHPEIVIGDYNSYEDYLNVLAKVDFDHEHYAKLGDGEKAVFRTMGAALEAKAIEEKLSMNLPFMTFVDVVRCGLTAQEIVNVFRDMKRNGISDTAIFSGCLNGTQTNSCLEKIIQENSNRGIDSLMVAYQEKIIENGQM